MTTLLQNDQGDIPSNTNDDDPANMLQELINQFSSSHEFLAIEQIQSIINNQNISNSNEIAKTNETIVNLKREIELKQNSLQMLNKVNDINYELIQTYTSSISNSQQQQQQPQINNSENIFQLIKSKSIEMENYKIKLIKELQDLTSSINNLNSNEIKFKNEINKINNKIENSINEFEKNLNLNSNELLEQDLTILLINLYKNLGINLESSKKSTVDSPIENEEFLDEPEDIMIIKGKDDNVTALPLEARYTEEFISNFIWDKID
ncbi:spc24 [Candida pseudojiufengensis]|uniref:spc24 n=1 Tax=Candida pseudojiufengensis TaxID=497109 RepID=UPI00222498EE|nr:spc24 [Candida pseudojiufengensis]KAI5963309.1 spc24 [Candida pseudojiufengensis]